MALNVAGVAMWGPSPMQGKRGNEELCWEMLLPIPYSPHRDNPCSTGTLPHPVGSQSLHPTPHTPGREV